MTRLEKLIEELIEALESLNLPPRKRNATSYFELSGVIRDFFTFAGLGNSNYMPLLIKLLLENNSTASEAISFDNLTELGYSPKIGTLYGSIHDANEKLLTLTPPLQVVQVRHLGGYQIQWTQKEGGEPTSLNKDNLSEYLAVAAKQEQLDDDWLKHLTYPDEYILRNVSPSTLREIKNIYDEIQRTGDFKVFFNSLNFVISTQEWYGTWETMQLLGKIIIRLLPDHPSLLDYLEKRIIKNIDPCIRENIGIAVVELYDLENKPIQKKVTGYISTLLDDEILGVRVTAMQALRWRAEHIYSDIPPKIIMDNCLKNDPLNWHLRLDAYFTLGTLLKNYLTANMHANEIENINKIFEEQYEKEEDDILKFACNISSKGYNPPLEGYILKYYGTEPDNLNGYTDKQKKALVIFSYLVNERIMKSKRFRGKQSADFQRKAAMNNPAVEKIIKTQNKKMNLIEMLKYF